MALSYKSRRRLSLLILLVWLPVYIGFALWLVITIGRPSNFFVEVILYVVLGFIWLRPLKFVFMGVGKPDPNKPVRKFLDDDIIAAQKAAEKAINKNYTRKNR